MVSSLFTSNSLIWHILLRKDSTVAFSDKNLSPLEMSQVLVEQLPFSSVWIMPVMIAAYLAIIIAYLPAADAKPQKLRPFSRFAIFVHNLVLAIYSLVVFCQAAPVVLGCIRTQESLSDAFQKCDGLVAPHTTFWMWTFYLSKYYEFLDTFIHLYRGSRPAFLQVYHHIGVVIVEWLGFYYVNPSSWMMIVFNSFVHTIMYSYYAMATYGWRFPVKQLITSVQLVQFLTFQVISFCYYMPWNNETLTQAQVYSIAYTQVYVAGLIYLFSRFFYRSYLATAAKKQEQKHH